MFCSGNSRVFFVVLNSFCIKNILTSFVNYFLKKVHLKWKTSEYSENVLFSVSVISKIIINSVA